MLHWQGIQEAEQKSQAELKALQVQKDAAGNRLDCAQSEIDEFKHQLCIVSAGKHAATSQLQSMQGDMQAVKQRLDALDADKQAAAKQLADSKAAHEEERARWQQQQQQWEAERAAKSEREQQLQRDMADMQATLAEYKAALAAVQSAEKKAAVAGDRKMIGGLCSRACAVSVALIFSSRSLPEQRADHSAWLVHGSCPMCNCRYQECIL